ncbi:MAG TPA: AbrB/MazE/SpoVT family DNA-binding domain-containing protein [Verrucomicrobiae bacterium]|jgi:AbrB family looped-hinge helix DNA binding protein|nr:AbrB/MazE/SpoVT family DNA-binding domain-containing protein [Verrucomicrobiae bacterium]
MSKITSKLQVTVPKAVADRFKIKPGDEIEWEAAGESIRIVPARRPRRKGEARDRLRLFDHATGRQREREKALGRVATAEDRGWNRADLYIRGDAR